MQHTAVTGYLNKAVSHRYASFNKHSSFKATKKYLPIIHCGHVYMYKFENLKLFSSKIKRPVFKTLDL